MPIRERGVDQIAYADKAANNCPFTSRPIHLKAATKECFSLTRKCGAVSDLIIVYIGHVVKAQAAPIIYTLSYEDARLVAKEMEWLDTLTWKNTGV